METPRDPNLRHYFRTLSSSEVKTLLKMIGESRPRFEVWEQNKEDYLETYDVLEVQEDKQHINFRPRPGFFQRLMGSKLTGKEIYFRLELGDCSYFSKSVLQYNPQTKSYSLSIVDAVFLGQQRRNYRLDAGHERHIALRANGELFQCLDVSAGGTSFNISAHDIFRYEVGQEFESCELYFNKKLFKIPCIQITTHTPISGPAKQEKVKLGIRFIFPKGSKEEELLANTLSAEAKIEVVKKKMAA